MQLLSTAVTSSNSGCRPGAKLPDRLDGSLNAVTHCPAQLSAAQLRSVCEQLRLPSPGAASDAVHLRQAHGLADMLRL